MSIRVAAVASGAESSSQAVLLAKHDWGLRPPLRWRTSGDPWSILRDPVVR
jgi:hypothetical protein